VHVGTGQLPVNGRNGEVERFGKQFEFEVHLNQPVDEDAPHFLVDVGLRLHVVCLRFHVCLGVETVVVHVNRLECAVQRVLAVLHVTCLLAPLEVDAVDHGCIPAVHEVRLFLFLFEQFITVIRDACVWFYFARLIIVIVIVIVTILVFFRSIVFEVWLAVDTGEHDLL